MPAAPPTADLAERTLELARIYRAERALVRQQLRGFGVRDAGLEDALHDVFVIAFRKLAAYDTQRGPLRAWLVGIAWRVAAAHRRRRETGVELLDDEVASDLPDPESYAARSEAAAVLDRLLRSLPPEQAAAFVLAELEGLSGAEIAEQWSIAPATAYTRVARARLKLQAELERSRYGRRPWWAVLFWPGGTESSGTAIVAAFVSMRVLIGIVAAIVLVGGVAWWLGDDDAKTDVVVADEQAPAPAAPTRAAPARARDDDDHDFGPRGTAASISGLVHASTGAPITAAEVCAWPEITEHGTPTPSCTTTLANGSYRIAGVLPSRYRVTASAQGFAPGEAAATAARGTSSLVLHAAEARTGVDIALAPGGVELRGLVSDVFGGVVDGARITVKRHSDFTRIDGPNSGPGVPVHATTAADGLFHVWVDAGDLDVVARAEGYGHALVRVRAPGPTVTISLLPESTLSGVVVDRETRAPIAGARVVLRTWAESTTHEETAAFSDDEGRFEIRGLVPGRYRPAAYADGLHGEAARSQILDLGGSIDDIVVEMIEAATLHAKIVVAPDDAPCPSGSVMLWDHTAEIVRTAVIAPGGIARFPALVPGDYGVVVACDDHDSSEVPTRIAVTGAAMTETWTVERGRAIRGHVLDAHGRPLVGQVMATPAGTGPDGAPHWASIASDGAYVLQGLASGDYSLTASTDGADLEGHTTVVDSDVVVEFEAPATVRLVGKVMRGAAPAAGISVIALPPGNEWDQRKTFAADSGAFEFAALAPGRYRVRAEDELGLRSPEQVAVLTAGREPSAIELAMPEPRSIRGVVVDEDGGPLRDALVSARATASMTTEATRRSELRAAKAGGPGTTLTDAHGEFVLTGVAAGETYTVVAQRRGGGSATKSGVGAGERARLQLAASATVRGTVRAQSGPSALWVELYADGGLVHRESFVGSGAFEFDDVDPGEYELRAIAREGRAKVNVIAKAGTSTAIDLQLIGNRTVRGRFVDLEDGRPLPGLWALFSEQGVSSQRIAIAAERAIQTRTPGLLTGADGVFTARDVPPTTATLLVMTGGFQYDALEDVMEALLVPQSHPLDQVVDIPIAKQRLSWDAAAGDLGFELEQVPLACSDTPRVAKVVDAAIATGLVAGDEIVTVDGHDVAGLRCYLVRALLRVPPDTAVELGLARGETVRVTAGPAK